MPTSRQFSLLPAAGTMHQSLVRSREVNLPREATWVLCPVHHLQWRTEEVTGKGEDKEARPAPEKLLPEGLFRVGYSDGETQVLSQMWFVLPLFCTKKSSSSRVPILLINSVSMPTTRHSTQKGTFPTGASVSSPLLSTLVVGCAWPLRFSYIPWIVTEPMFQSNWRVNSLVLLQLSVSDHHFPSFHKFVHSLILIINPTPHSILGVSAFLTKSYMAAKILLIPMHISLCIKTQSLFLFPWIRGGLGLALASRPWQKWLNIGLQKLCIFCFCRLRTVRPPSEDI